MMRGGGGEEGGRASSAQKSGENDTQARHGGFDKLARLRITVTIVLRSIRMVGLILNEHDASEVFSSFFAVITPRAALA